MRGEIRASSFMRSNTCWLQMVRPVVVIAIIIVTKTLTKLRARRQADWSSAAICAASKAAIISWSLTFSGCSASRWRRMADPLAVVSFHFFHSVYTVNNVFRCSRHEMVKKCPDFFKKVNFNAYFQTFLFFVWSHCFAVLLPTMVGTK